MVLGVFVLNAKSQSTDDVLNILVQKNLIAQKDAEIFLTRRLLVLLALQDAEKPLC